MFIFGENLWKSFTSCLVLSGDTGYILKNGRIYSLKKDPFLAIEEFVCGEEGEKVGYISYNLSRLVEDIKCAEDDLGLPDAVLVSFSRKDRKEKFSFDSSYHILKLPDESVYLSPFNNSERERFISNITSIKREIFMGNVYQVNISRRIDIPRSNLSPFEVFKRYTTIQKTRFPAFFDFSFLGRDFVLASGSMELFLQRSGRMIREAPIKGTRKNTGVKELHDICDDLRSDEKEIAENLMIVDMVRNDLGRVCVPGSVKVVRLFDVEVFSTVIHLVSEVEGELSSHVGLSDILRATFPPASVTGAPKKSAMQIIENLEGKRRGPYCGAICHFSDGLDFTMSVAIRIFVYLRGRFMYWTGCGIVWDSDPENEWLESVEKTRAFALSMLKTIDK